MNQSPFIKTEAEHQDPRPSYIFDLNKFSPSLKLIKRFSIASKTSSPSLNQSMKKDSHISPLFLEDRTRQTIIEQPQGSNATKNGKNFFMSKATLKLKRTFQSEAKTSSSVNKLSMSSSYLISDHFSIKGKNSEVIAESSQERVEKLEDYVKSTVNNKFQKINRLANEFQLSNETYFSPYHLTLYNKLISKMGNPDKKVSFNDIEENKRFPFELVINAHILLRIHTKYNSNPLHLNCNVHKGSFQAFIGRNSKVGLQNHEITFANVRNSFISLEKMGEIDSIFINVLALTELKMSVDYYFEVIQPKFEEKKLILPEMVSMNEINEANSGIVEIKKANIIKRNKFFIKKTKNIRLKEFKKKTELFDSLATFNRERTSIKTIYDKIIKNLKSQSRQSEVFK